MRTPILLGRATTLPVPGATTSGKPLLMPSWLFTPPPPTVTMLSGSSRCPRWREKELSHLMICRARHHTCLKNVPSAMKYYLSSRRWYGYRATLETQIGGLGRRKHKTMYDGNSSGWASQISADALPITTASCVASPLIHHHAVAGKQRHHIYCRLADISTTR